MGRVKVMTLLLDRRVGSIELHTLLTTPHSVCELDYGDAVVLGSGAMGDIGIGIERKRIRDLISSMESGRLVAHQIPGMLEEFERAYVVVEGLWKPDRNRNLCLYGKGGFKPLRYGKRRYGSKDIHSFLLSIQEMFGVRVIITGSATHTAAWIDDIHYWYNKSRHRTGEVMMTNPIPANGWNGRRPSTVALVAKELKGVGGRKALDLAKIFPTVQDLVNATVPDIMKVPGIGQTIAEGIWRQLREVR
jgi:ERCC4-type nuclease